MFDQKSNFQSQVIKKITELKFSPFGTVAIDSFCNSVNYKILLLTSDCDKNSELMELIGKWRKENEKWFLSQFKVTVERTTKWFKEKVIGAPDRLLFIIKAGNTFIGHVGLFRFDFKNRACEIDNIVRGELGYPGIMSDAVCAMMNWARENLGIITYSLKVVSDNDRAIRFYQKMGFKELARIPLIQKEGNDGLEWIEATDQYTKYAKRYYVVMELG